MNRQPPYARYPSAAVVIHIDKGELPEFLEELEQSKDRCIVALRQTCAKCWRREPNRRPDIATIVTDLEKALSSRQGQYLIA